jgi:AraC-like DNA-binding protein
MITLTYFADMEPVGSGAHRNYRGHITDRSPRNYSVELMASGRMYFQRKPGRAHAFKKPTLRWQSPGYTYSYGPLDENGWEHYFITFRGNRAEKLYREGFCRLSEEVFMPVRRVNVFRDLFTAIHHSLLHRSTHNANAVVYLEQVLVRAAEELAGHEAEGRHAGEFDRICSRINLDPGSGVDFPQLARQMDLSCSHFRKSFTEHTGIAPHQYVLRARLRAAALRLERTDDALKRIARELGLGDAAQFSKTFRRHYGMPPGAYRRSARQGPGR